MRRCNGVLDSGRRCSVVPLPGNEYCRTCEAKEARGEMPALKPAKMPVEPVKPLRAHDLKPVKKTVISDRPASSPAPAANVADTASVRENHAAEPLHFATADMHSHACGGAISVDTLSTTVWEEVTCEHCLIWKPTDAVPGTDLGQVAAGSFEPHQSEGNPEKVQGDHLAGAGKLIELQDCGCGMGHECMRATEVEIQPVAYTPPQEQIGPLLVPGSALRRLLRPVQLPTPPLPPTAIVLDFNADEFAAIQAENITPQECKELILMLVAGEIGKIIQVEDPLAKSRLHAGE